MTTTEQTLERLLTARTVLATQTQPDDDVVWALDTLERLLIQWVPARELTYEPGTKVRLQNDHGIAFEGEIIGFPDRASGVRVEVGFAEPKLDYLRSMGFTVLVRPDSRYAIHPRYSKEQAA